MSISVLRVHEKKRRKMENLKEISALEMKVEALRLKNDLLREENLHIKEELRLAIKYQTKLKNKKEGFIFKFTRRNLLFRVSQNKKA